MKGRGPERCVDVRAAARADAPELARLRAALWPEDDLAAHRAAIERYFDGGLPGGPWVVLVAVDRGRLVGFAEASVRPFAEGCHSEGVGYLEGWYVRADVRHRGVGAALLAETERWARARGCVEFASDADPANETSVAAHRALGFEDAGLVRCFRKDLERDAGAADG